MAQVFLGQRSDGQVAAVKVLLPHFAQNEEIVQRFLREMSAGAALRGDHVVEIIEFGEVNGRHFLATEFMDAGSLRDLVVRSGGRLPPPVAEAIVVMLLRALAVAHASGVIHRDVKPANVLLSSNGTAKLSDFGIARALDLPGLTRTGLLMGTPSYMSPEQAAGQPLDGRTDLFAAGIVLYELLCGFNPFFGPTDAASLMKVIDGDVPLPFEIDPTLPPHLEPLLARLLEHDPGRRYATAEDALADFKRLSPEPLDAPGKIVREALQDPAGTARLWRRTQAQIHLDRANLLLRADGPPRPQALLALYRAHLLDPQDTGARDRLRQLLGGREPFAPSHNPKIAELEAALTAKPRQHALWMQLAALCRTEAQLLKAIGAYKRALRLRPDDGFAAGQLRALIGEEADLTLTSGHLTLKTMPPRPPSAFQEQRAASGPATLGHAAPLLAPVPIRSPLRTLAPRMAGAAVAAAALFFGVRALSGFIDRSIEETDRGAGAFTRALEPGAAANQPPPSVEQHRERLTRQARTDFRRASDLARGGASDEAQRALQAFLDDHPNVPERADALLLLGDSFLRADRPLSAAQTLRQFIDEWPSEPRVPEARWMLARALEASGDEAAARDELDALVESHPASPVVTRAMLRAGELHERLGDPATARARYELVRARTGPADAAHVDAVTALERVEDVF